MHRLSGLNDHFKFPKTTDFWQRLGLDHHMSDVAIRLRKAAAKLMVEEYHALNRCYERELFPHESYKKVKDLGVMGLTIQGYGSPGLTTIEAASICFELSKLDSSFGGFFIVHNCVAMATIYALGDEE